MVFIGKWLEEADYFFYIRGICRDVALQRPYKCH